MLVAGIVYRLKDLLALDHGLDAGRQLFAVLNVLYEGIDLVAEMIAGLDLGRILDQRAAIGGLKLKCGAVA